MKKITTTILIVLSVILLLIIIGAIILYLSNYLSIRNSPPSEKPYLITKAICNESNYCEDYEIICQNNEIMSIRRITEGNSLVNVTPEDILALIERDKSLFGLIQFSPEWSDPRIKEKLEDICKQ